MGVSAALIGARPVVLEPARVAPVWAPRERLTLGAELAAQFGAGGGAVHHFALQGALRCPRSVVDQTPPHNQHLTRTFIPVNLYNFIVNPRIQLTF